METQQEQQQITIIDHLEALRTLGRWLAEKAAEFRVRFEMQAIQLEEAGLNHSERLDQITVTDAASQEELAGALLAAVHFSDEATEFFEPWRKLFYEPYAAINQRKGVVLAAPAEAIKRAKTRLLAFQRDEEERARLEARERQRKQNEAEQERKLELASRAETAGLGEQAVQQILDAPSAMPTVQPAALAKPTGVAARKNWKAEVFDKAALVKAAAKDKDLLVYLDPNMPNLNREAKTHELSLAIPGVRAVNEGSVAVRR